MCGCGHQVSGCVTVRRGIKAGVTAGVRAEWLRVRRGKTLAGVITVFWGFLWKKGFNSGCLQCADRKRVVSQGRHLKALFVSEV